MGNIQDDCLHWFDFGFVTGFSKHELYMECSFERGSENSFVQMWSIPHGFFINERRSCSEA
jgi:hypothetical protein